MDAEELQQGIQAALDQGMEESEELQEQIEQTLTVSF